MHTIVKCILWLLLLTGFCSIAHAQTPAATLNFRTFTENEGLSNNAINDIQQDHNGIIWLATDNGICRYDGQRFKTFNGLKDGNRFIPFSRVRQINITDDNGLWITTATNLYYMDIRTEQFYNAGNFNNPVIFREDGKYQLSDDVNFYALPSLQTLRSRKITKTGLVNWGTGSKPYSRLFFDRHGDTWSLYKDKIFKVSKSSRQVEKTIATNRLSLQSMFFDSKNRCWIATWGNGIFLLDSSSGTLRQFPVLDNQYVAFQFKTWRHNNKSYLVVCSDKSLLLIDENTLEYERHAPSDFFTNTALDDKNNNLWIGGNHGLMLVSAKQDLFKIIPVSMPGQNQPSGVYIIKQLGENFWLSKRYFRGIYQFDNAWSVKNYWESLAPFKGRHEFSNSNEAFDFIEHEGNTFMTTDTGMFVINERSVKKLLVPHFITGKPSMLRNIEPENDSTWLIRSYSDGIYRFNNITQKFTGHYPLKDSNEKPQPVHYLLKTRKGQVLVTSYEGIFHFNTQTNKFEKVLLKNAPSEYMLGMAEDKNGIVWVASSNGIFSYDPVNRKIKELFTSYGDMGYCYRICVDKHNNIWFNCQKGYWCWMQDKQHMAKFSYNMGLPDNRQEAGFAALPNGYVYGGANNAVVQFDPAALINYRNNAHAFITDIHINQAQHAGVVTNDSAQQIKLGPGKYNLDILFSVTDYSSPGYYELYYQLQPGSEEWIASEEGNINFSSLAYGNYTIAVKGKNNLTGDFSRPYLLELTIAPYWYQTLWFKILFVAMIAAIIFYLVKRRVTQIRKEATLNQKIAESEMQLLRSQMNPHFIFNTLNSIENFIMQNEKRLASDYLNKFAKLIRMILNSSRMELVPLTLDMEALQLYIDLEKLRLNHKFSYTITLDEELRNGDYKVPSLLIQPYVENAILHGLAQSEANNLQLDITAGLKGERILFTVTDNGIGRKQSGLYKSANRPYHKSVGMEINRERILRFNRKLKPAEAVKIIDLYNEKAEPAGTKIEILIDTI